MARQPTELEQLNRDHNWKQGQLRRLAAAVGIMHHGDNALIAGQAIDAEIAAVKADFEAEKTRIKENQ